MASKFDFKELRQGFKLVKEDIVKSVARNTLLFFQTNYEKQGWEDKSFQSWQPRKKAAPTKLLVKTGKLKRSIKIKEATLDKISIATDVPYAPYHNDGTSTIPQRPFLYESAKLVEETKKLIEEKIDKYLR